ncbi:MAG: glutamine-hydrolyzing carbamoyl-phosphate synthase small subunit [Candidatus Hodarchaeota archaeon]
MIYWPQEEGKPRCQRLKARSSRNNAALVLEDGTVFLGRGFGSPKKVAGEVVFNTGMVGYPESMTDSSYYEQILTLTHPLIGNYGIPSFGEIEYGIPKFFESDSMKINGLVVHEYCHSPNHWSSVRTLDQWLKDEGVPAIMNVDTRRLTKRLRERGTMLGILHVCGEEEELDIPGLREEARNIENPNERNLVEEVAADKPIVYDCCGKGTVVILDCGVKYNIIRSFLKRNLNVVRVPYNTSVSKIIRREPDGVVISNGPGDPKRIPSITQTVADIIRENIPLLGICLGTQILSLACGGDTYKLKYGHRSQNQPSIDLETGRCFITSQNHGYAVEAISLKKTDLGIWFVNANDKTIEGIRHKRVDALAVQFHPEHTPGPTDTEYIFDQFIQIMEGQRSAKI